MATQQTRNVGLIALPMHGQRKLVEEGYRTRDGHIIEWAGALLANAQLGSVCVVSRPEPWLISNRRRPISPGRIANNTFSNSRRVAALPLSLDRQRWWLSSAKYYRLPKGVDPTTPFICWNPFVFEAPPYSKRGIHSHFDLLDDWTVHYAFENLWPEVRRAYGRAFDTARTVTANSEATLDLAYRYGRSDAKLVLNGCDPDRFSTESNASGGTTIGYVGKIGKRLDLDLIVNTAKSLPSHRFIFAGPILDPGYRKPLSRADNITLLGDVHYDDVPSLLRSFDVGWVPHHTGEGEVGGDVIKIYEYRAAGLPVLSTQIIGANRGLAHVSYLPPHEHADWIANLPANGGRVPRLLTELPSEVSWRSKAITILNMLELEVGHA